LIFYLLFGRELQGALETFSLILWRWKEKSDEIDEEETSPPPPAATGSSPPVSKRLRYPLSSSPSPLLSFLVPSPALFYLSSSPSLSLIYFTVERERD
jgi:hypothetical protein